MNSRGVRDLPSAEMNPAAAEHAYQLQDAVRAHYDRVASTWRKKVWVHDSEVRAVTRAFFRVPVGTHLLDVGTGAGDLVSLLPDSPFPVGLDISKRLLVEGQKLNAHLPLVQGDAAALPFPPERFDVVSSRNLLQCFDDPRVPVKEIFRVAKHSGWIFMVESAVSEHERPMPTAVCRVVEPWHPLFPSHERLHDLLDDCGVGEIRQEVLGIRRRWLSRWQQSKQASDRQREQIYRICESYPEWYKTKYQFEFYPDECEVESVLTFSLLRARKS